MNRNLIKFVQYVISLLFSFVFQKRKTAKRETPIVFFCPVFDQKASEKIRSFSPLCITPVCVLSFAQKNKREVSGQDEHKWNFCFYLHTFGVFYHVKAVGRALTKSPGKTYCCVWCSSFASRLILFWGAWCAAFVFCFCECVSKCRFRI
jgi:hypothetical protein